jgi:DNA-binding response OmpR family regulator
LVLYTTRRLELLVLADERIHSQLSPALSIVSGQVATVATAEALLRQLWERVPDVILLESSGQPPGAPALCAQIRECFQTAILVVAASGREAERIAWLDAGADDLIVLPDATPAELSARCHALIRRVQRQLRRDPAALRLQALGMQLDVAERRLYLPDGRPLDLSAGLTRLLGLFFCYGDAIVPSETLGLHMFGRSVPNLPRRLYALSQLLIQRTAGVPGPVPRLQLLRGSGYRLTLSDPAAASPRTSRPAHPSKAEGL